MTKRQLQFIGISECRCYHLLTYFDPVFQELIANQWLVVMFDSKQHIRSKQQYDVMAWALLM